METEAREQDGGSYLNEHEVPEHVDVPEIPQAEERGEEATEKHAGGQVVTQGEPLPENPTGEQGSICGWSRALLNPASMSSPSSTGRGDSGQGDHQ